MFASLYSEMDISMDTSPSYMAVEAYDCLNELIICANCIPIEYMVFYIFKKPNVAPLLAP